MRESEVVTFVLQYAVNDHAFIVDPQTSFSKSPSFAKSSAPLGRCAQSPRYAQGYVF
jgi:hypothetical protein